MKRRTLGATGISVSEYALGAMMFGAIGNKDHDESVRIIHAALDAGINLIDTADVYSSGESEVIVGKAIKGRRHDVVLATKFGLPMGADPNQRGGSRRWIIYEVEESLRRLGVDHIDLYQMHRADYDTELDETLSALTDLVRAGKVRAIGSSTFSAERIVEAQWAAERNGLLRFATEQPRYSILTRSLETHILPTAQRYKLGVLTYGPLASGWLSGRADPAQGHRASVGAARVFDLSIAENQAKVAAVRKLTALAAEVSMTLPQLALGFVLAHPAITSVLIGPRTSAHLESTLAHSDTELSEELLDKIDEIVAPGTDVNPMDNYNTDPPSLTDKRLRRR